MPSAGMEQAGVRLSYTPNGKPGSHIGFNLLFHNMKDVHPYIARCLLGSPKGFG